MIDYKELLEAFRKNRPKGIKGRIVFWKVRSTLGILKWIEKDMKKSEAGNANYHPHREDPRKTE